MDEKALYVTFYTTREAMETEEAMRTASVIGKLVPVPRNISSTCGLAWKGSCQDRDKIIGRLKEKGIDYEEIVEI